MIRQVGEAIASASWANLSPAAKQKLKHCVVANFSVALAGLPYARLPEPVPSQKGHFLFSGRRTAVARDAAFWNAAVMHARTQDDFHPIGNLHAATVLFPAAMAAAEASGASGEQFLDALVAGYAAAAGLSCAFSPKTTPKGLRSTGLYSPCRGCFRPCPSFLTTQKLGFPCGLASSYRIGRNFFRSRASTRH